MRGEPQVANGVLHSSLHVGSVDVDVADAADAADAADVEVADVVAAAAVAVVEMQRLGWYLSVHSVRIA